MNTNEELNFLSVFGPAELFFVIAGIMTVLEFFKSWLGLQNFRLRQKIINDNPQGSVRSMISLGIGVLEVLGSTIEGGKVLVVARLPIYVMPALGIGIGAGSAAASRWFKQVDIRAWHDLEEVEENNNL